MSYVELAIVFASDSSINDVVLSSRRVRVFS